MTNRSFMLAVLLTGAGLCGCDNDPKVAYTTRSQYVGNVRSVAVPIWTRGREVYRRNLEQRLTEAVVKRIGLDTPYTITSRQRADTLLTGSIDLVEQRVLSLNPDTGLARELEIVMTVTFTWEDLRNGKILARQKGLRVTGTYFPPDQYATNPTDPFNEDFFLGSEDVLNRVARAVVEKMEAKW